MENNLEPEDRLKELLHRLSSNPIMSPPKEAPLSLPQALILDWVSRFPGCGVLDIAKGLHVTPPTASVSIRRLVRDNWLEQRRDSSDRRARPIYLTEKGSSFVETLKNHRSERLKRFLSGLTDEEKEQLVGLLDRAVSALENVQESI